MLEFVFLSLFYCSSNLILSQLCLSMHGNVIRKDEQEIGMELGSGGQVGRECLSPCVFRGFFLYREVLFYKKVKK